MIESKEQTTALITGELEELTSQMESLQLEESKQVTPAQKTHLTTIELLSNKPLTGTQIDGVFDLLNARKVPTQEVK